MTNTNTPPTDDSRRRPPRRRWGLAVGIIGALILVLVVGAALVARSGLVSNGAKTATAPTSGTQSGSAAVRAWWRSTR